MKNKENQNKNKINETNQNDARADIFHIVSKEEKREESFAGSDDIEALEDDENLEEGEDILEDLFGNELKDEAYKKADDLARWAGVNEVRIRRRIREREKRKERAKEEAGENEGALNNAFRIV